MIIIIIIIIITIIFIIIITTSFIYFFMNRNVKRTAFIWNRSHNINVFMVVIVFMV